MKAKAKSKSKVNGKAVLSARKNGKTASAKSPTLPDGYRVIGRAPAWDMDKNPVLEGERGEITDVVFPPRKKGDKKEVRRTMIINDETIGAVAVWQSSMLKDFFDKTEEGQQVRIEFLGYGTAKKGQNAPRLYSCAVKD